METKRLFIGTLIDNSLFMPVYEDIQKEFEPAVKGKWVEIENLHFTYKFLGDVDVLLIPKISSSLSKLLVRYNSRLLFKGLGAFPNFNRPQILYANFWNPEKKVFQKHKEIDHILSEYGFRPEKRKFMPHMTLLRIKSFNQPDFSTILAKYKDKEFGIMNGFEISLIQSELTKTGPIYEKIELTSK